MNQNRIDMRTIQSGPEGFLNFSESLLDVIQSRVEARIEPHLNSFTEPDESTCIFEFRGHLLGLPSKGSPEYACRDYNPTEMFQAIQALSLLQRFRSEYQKGNHHDCCLIALGLGGILVWLETITPSDLLGHFATNTAANKGRSKGGKNSATLTPTRWEKVLRSLRLRVIQGQRIAWASRDISRELLQKEFFPGEEIDVSARHIARKFREHNKKQTTSL